MATLNIFSWRRGIMILELNIRNVSLISELRLEPGNGLVVLTGETGAGKSILLGALSLLLGERASIDSIRTGCEIATVEALFDVAKLSRIGPLLESHGLSSSEDQTLLLKREISRQGRGKCYVNGGLATLNILREIGDELVDLHGQHEHQSLLHRDRQQDLIDAWGGLNELRSQVNKIYVQLRSSREARKRLALDEAERARRLDLLNFQVNEIEEAGLQPGEFESLSEEKSRLTHAERLLGTVQGVLEILYRRENTAVRDGLAEAAESLAGLSAFDSNMGMLADDIRSAEAQVSEVTERLSDFTQTFEADPERLVLVEERLDVLHTLQRKYGENAGAILSFRDQAVVEREKLGNQDEEVGRLAQEEGRLAAELSELAERLSNERREAGEKLAGCLEAELKELGFLQAVFKVKVLPREDPAGWIGWAGKNFRCGPRGADEVEFLIAPNPGEELKPVSRTASGGELSRIMLAIKAVAASAAEVPVMIFDEIDAGIGGATAEAVGRKLAALAKERQVIVITHLAQIARFAHAHFQV
ncbi:DNA repair protein RecN, partial [bacterium]|nr:DNA repair protein RecN [bacterium]